MTNGWSKQAYVKGFDCKTFTFKSVKICECMEISETIYEGVVEPS